MREDRIYQGRPVRRAAATDHLVAFLDILGFRKLLLENEFDRLLMVFEELSDAIYQCTSAAFRNGLTPIAPSLVNFSDSIIVLVRIEPSDSEVIRHLKYRLLFEYCRAVIATGLRSGIPIRGGISKGPLVVDVAASEVPTSVFRYGALPAEVIEPMAERFGAETVLPMDYASRVFSPVEIPIHMGPALTEAYLLESSINSIGCFLHSNIAKLPFIESFVGERRLATHEVDGIEYLAVNWCNYWHNDVFQNIVENATSQAHHEDSRVGAKWESLLHFARSAPKTGQRML